MARRKAQPLQKSNVELDYAKFGTLLKRLIKSKGYTQENFAKAVGVSYSSLMSILKGKRRVFLHTYLKMLDVLEVSDLILLNESPNYPELIERANLYKELLSTYENLSLSTLEHVDSLLLALDRAKFARLEESNC